MIRFWSIARNTFVQTIREPIFGILVLATYVILAISLVLSGWTMDPSAEYQAADQRMMEDLGLSTLLVAGLLVAAFSASAALSREIEDRTALTVISKPVSRATFVLGKFAGVAGVVAVAYYLMSLGFLMTVRHGVQSSVTVPPDWPVIVLGAGSLVLAVLVALAGNILFGWSFASTAAFAALILMTVAGVVIGFVGKGWRLVPFGIEVSPQLATAVVLTFMGVMVFTAVAVTASTRLGQIMTLLVCTAVLFVGYLYPFLFREAGKFPILRLLSWLWPNLRLFDAQAALSAGKTIPGDYLAMAALYTLLYVGAVLAAGIALFQRRALEAQEGSSTMPSGINIAAWGGRALAATLGMAGAICLSLPRFQHPAGIAVSIGMIVLAAALWVLAGAFGRGARWSYWIVLVGCAAALAGGLVIRLHPAVAMPEALRVAMVVAMVAAAGLLILLVLPKTRLHFKSARQ